MTCRIAILAALLILVAQSHAATRYVSHSGNNTFPYTTWGTAANTIEAANLATLPGDTMFVDTGSFYLSAMVYTQPRITMRGKGSDSTYLYGSSSINIMIRPGDSTTVEDMYFVGNGSYYAIAKFADEPERTVVIRRSSFTENHLVLNDNRSIEISDCYFEKWPGFALDLTGTGDLAIQNNTFVAPDAVLSFCSFIGNTGTIILHKNIFVGGGSLGFKEEAGRLMPATISSITTSG